jgi:hypothetical protein
LKGVQITAGTFDVARRTMNSFDLYFQLSLLWLALLIGGVAYVLPL